MDLFEYHLRNAEMAFGCLQACQQTQALAMVNDLATRLHNIVRQCLDGDALKTVQSVAESIIQETYGFGLEHEDDLGFTSLRKMDRVDQPPLSDVIFDNMRMQTNAADDYQPTMIQNSEIGPYVGTDEQLLHKNADLQTNHVTLQAASEDLVKDSGDSASAKCHRGPLVADAACCGNSGETKNNRTFDTSETFLYECPVESCKFRTNFRQSLHRHTKRVHCDKDERKFSCETCNNKFFTKSALHEHIVYKHAGERQFGCKFCNVQFNLKKDLNRHYRCFHKNVCVPDLSKQ